MNIFLYIFLLTALTGLGGLALGGLLAVILRRENPKAIAMLLALAGGIILSVACFHMIPEAFHHGGNPWLPSLCLLGGFLVTYLLNCWMNSREHHAHPHHPDQCACGHHHHDLHAAGMMLAVAIALHNMPVGMAIGTTVAASGISTASLLAASTIGLHNVPEGMSICVPLLSDGTKPVRAVGTAMLCGIPSIVGAFLGYFVGSANPVLLAVALCFAAGTMLYVIFFELVPEALRNWKSPVTILLIVAGIALGLTLLHLTPHVH